MTKPYGFYRFWEVAAEVAVKVAAKVVYVVKLFVYEPVCY